MFAITLEPLVFMRALGELIVNGAQTTTDLLFWKICHLEQNHTEEICSNLTYYETIKDDVQRQANDIQMVTSWLRSGPALIYTLFAGSLADDFGFKPFILLPCIGTLVSDIGNAKYYANFINYLKSYIFIGMLINCIFIEEVPLQFFYFESLGAFFGGTAVFYLGVYGYGTSVSQAKARASTLARYDGMETLGLIFGTLLSPVILQRFNPTAVYICKIGTTLFVILYLIFLVKEPKRNYERVRKSKAQMVIQPLVDMIKAIFKTRPNKLHILLAIQFYCFGSYWFAVNEKQLRYLYLNKTLDFDGVDFAWITVFTTSINTVGLLLVLPFLSYMCQMHDTFIQTIVITGETIGCFLYAFSTEVWQVYGSTGVMELLGYCKYGLVRSIMSKCVEPDETGKMFSALAILCAAMPLAGNPAFRQLYDSTLDTFPAAEVLLAGSIYCISALLNLILYTQRWRINLDTSGKSSKEIEPNTEYSISHM